MNRDKDVLIIGIGNLYRGDDGVGIEIVRRLQGDVPPGVSLLEATGEGTALLDAWRGFDEVYVCDAVSAGAPAGHIYRLDAVAEPVPRSFFNYSTHAFALAEAVEMARVLGELPRRLVIYGVEGETFASGRGLSAALELAANVVAAQLKEELRGLAASPRQSQNASMR